MASKAKERKGVCGTCRHGEWVLDKPTQRDIHGQPILIYCPYREHAVSRGMPCCEMYELGERER